MGLVELFPHGHFFSHGKGMGGWHSQYHLVTDQAF
jgi:hypothetical protein